MDILEQLESLIYFIIKIIFQNKNFFKISKKEVFELMLPYTVMQF